MRYLCLVELLQPFITLLAALIGALIALLAGWLSAGRQHRFNIEMLRLQTRITAWSSFITNLTEYRAAELRRLHLLDKMQEESSTQEVRQLRTKCRDSLLQLALAEADYSTIQKAGKLIEDIRSIGHATEVSEGLLISEQISDRMLVLINENVDHKPMVHPVSSPRASHD